jgi:hypothetical protein
VETNASSHPYLKPVEKNLICFVGSLTQGKTNASSHPYLKPVKKDLICFVGIPQKGILFQ